MIVFVKILFISAFILLLSSYFLYPVILWIYGFFIKLRINKTSQYNPAVTLVISAFNEEKVIEKKILNSLKIHYPNLNIVVVSDGSTDNTRAICQKYADRVKLFHFEQNQGKNAALNKTLESIDTEVIVFSDANCFYQEDAVTKLIRNLEDERVGCVVGQLKLMQTDDSDIAKGEGLYWRFEHLLKKLESRIGQLSVANGSIFAVRRKLLNPLESNIANDFQIPMLVGAEGYYVIYEPEAIAFEKTAVNAKEEFHRKVRIVNRGIVGFLKLKLRIRGIRLFEFVFHKLIRWFTGILAVVIFTTSLLLLDNPFFKIMIVLQSIFYLMATVGYLFHRKEKYFYIPYYFCMVHLAATIGIIKVFTGRTFSKWESPSSAR